MNLNASPFYTTLIPGESDFFLGFMTITQDQINQGIQEMGYLEDFEKALVNQDPPSLLRLWEEYTASDQIDGKDFLAILEAIKRSDLCDYIGRHIEKAFPLLEKIQDEETKGKIIQLIIDLEATGSDVLRCLAMSYLEKTFGMDPQFNEKMRLIGLRSPGDDFKGSISNFILLNHMKKGNFVFHLSGWGVGEIIEVSMLREQLNLEFDYIPGRKDLPFKICFSILIPLPKEHFLAQRFGNPDDLETKAKQQPVEVIRMLLQDLGPKTAGEIKDELCELVIPENEWNRWWQTVRGKIKKDTRIENPKDLKDPFRLLTEDITHEERLKKALEKKPDADTLIQMIYSFLKDFSDTLKNAEFKKLLVEKLNEVLSFQEITEAQEIQVHFFLQDLLGRKEYAPVEDKIKSVSSIKELVDKISIQAFKKRVFTEIRRLQNDWQKIFIDLLLVVDQNLLRDYFLSELIKSNSLKELHTRLEDLCVYPQKYPDALIWYFQKITNQKDLPFADSEGKSRFFEALLILLSYLEQKGQRRELIKKIHGILFEGRYQVVRKILKEANVNQVQEFLLLITKCHSFSDHDIKIFHSLAEVAHPSLVQKHKKKEPIEELETIWTTKEGYLFLQKRIEQIGTVETVENAKEIEIARAHGDLRENAEFKAALERRDRLQAELKFLSDQLNKCRILTKEDIDTSQVNVGTTIECKDSAGNTISYTLLGPWDANLDENILSFQSKIAKSMIGLKVGDAFVMQGKKLTILAIRSALKV